MSKEYLEMQYVRIAALSMAKTQSNDRLPPEPGYRVSYPRDIRPPSQEGFPGIQ
jgi:hypothetical protein